MSYWKCPNKAKIPDHKDTILFREESRLLAGFVVPYMQVPKPVLCEICNRYYTRDECIKVEQ